MELVSDNADYDVVEGEPPELLGRNLASAGHLLASATAFFFLAFVFAYFYLRSLNNAGMWKPKHVDTSVTWGTIVTACIVASAVAVRLGLSDHRAGDRPAWRRKGAVGLGLGLAALVLQVVAWTQQGFGPADGGGFFRPYGWVVAEERSMLEEGRRLRREMRLAWLWRLLWVTEKQRTQARRVSLVIELVRA